MRFLVEAGFTYQVHVEALKVAITAVRGGDPRTLKNWIQTLERLGFIEKMNPLVYQMNLESIPELLNIVVKSGQKKLMQCASVRVDGSGARLVSGEAIRDLKGRKRVHRD